MTASPHSAVAVPRLVTRADDAGLNAATNEGIRVAVENGIARNVSVLALGCALDDAAAQLRDLDACFGFHACLNSEWAAPCWSPLTAHNGLVDARGMLPATWAELQALNPDPDMVIAEISAQLARLRGTGLPIHYMDEHMVFSAALPDIRPVLEDFARREGLIYRMDLRGLPFAPGEEALSAGDHPGRFLHRLQAVSSGTWLVVAHPAVDSPEMGAVRMDGQAHGEVAADRCRQALVFTAPAILAYCSSRSVRLLRYDELDASGGIATTAV
jgi:chitin disaccharide deacetylase